MKMTNMSTTFALLSQVDIISNVKYNITDRANDRNSHEPAELEPDRRIVSDHVLETVVETVDAEPPRYSDALKENDPQQD